MASLKSANVIRSTVALSAELPHVAVVVGKQTIRLQAVIKVDVHPAIGCASAALDNLITVFALVARSVIAHGFNIGTQKDARVCNHCGNC